ncbi:MAG: S8 family peptidase [Bacteroidetes bacterium]|nr:S8 family peptidase [Bacteroidota bacterium]
MFNRFTFFILLAFASLDLLSQHNCNPALIQQLEMEQPAATQLDILVQVRPGKLSVLRSMQGVNVHYTAGNVASVTAAISAVRQLASHPDILYMEYIKPGMKTMTDTMMVRNRIIAAKTGMSPLTQAYDGTGVIVGIIDSGIDFHHPDFKDAAGNTRIKYIWDMTVASPTTIPVGFSYGQEWTAADINAGNCTHTDLAQWGHGTHVAGIAAGNGSAIGHYEGVAPKADIIVVALDFNRPGPTIADAVNYITAKAYAAGKPFVINASVGDYMGSHDGTDLQAQMISAQISGMPGRVMVAAGGNAGAIPFHVGYNPTATDTNFFWISVSGNSLSLSLYADTNDIKNVKYSVGCNNPNNFSDLGRIPFKAYNYPIGSTRHDTIYHNTNRIGVVNSVAGINASGVYELDLSVNADSSGYLWRIENTGPGRIDAWTFDVINDGLPTAAQYPRITKYIVSDTNQTIVSSFQCSDEVITVANYVNRNQFIDVAANTQTTTETPGQISASSSRGPTRRNHVKPEIGASGATSLSCGVISMLPGLISSNPEVVAQGGYHVVGGGTSAASPLVAGLAALYLQMDPTATNQQVRQAIINCAYTDAFTGTNLPNNRFGYGKLDGFHAMTCNSLVTSAHSEQANDGWNIYPNPANQSFTIQSNTSAAYQVVLFDMLGNKVSATVSAEKELQIHTAHLPAGIYMLEIQQGGHVLHRKMIIER